MSLCHRSAKNYVIRFTSVRRRCDCFRALTFGQWLYVTIVVHTGVDSSLPAVVYAATGSRSAVPRDRGRRHTGDVTVQPDAVSLLYGDVVARPLLHDLRWNCTTVIIIIIITSSSSSPPPPPPPSPSLSPSPPPSSSSYLWPLKHVKLTDQSRIRIWQLPEEHNSHQAGRLL